jgi:hypothetical protein
MTDAPVPVARGTQMISIPVSGGSMWITPSRVTIALHPDQADGRLTGSFGPIVVTDTRGTLSGWELTASDVVSPVGTVTAEIIPGAATALTGLQSEATAGYASAVGGGQSSILMRAPQGGGGGKFAISGTVSLTSNGGQGASTVTLDLAIN